MNACDAVGNEAVKTFRKGVSGAEAIRLIELGARASLASQLTGIEKAVAKRLYLQVHGHPSPPGQMPFTDAWYLQSNQRLLQASIAWRVDRGLRHLKRRPARRLIDAYEYYQCAVREPLLDITHVAFVPRLVNIGLWQRRVCDLCSNAYVGPVTDVDSICPGCRLYRPYRCANCGTPLNPRPVGRNAELCAECRRGESSNRTS